MDKLKQRPCGRPAHGQASKLISFRLPLEMAERLDEIAESQNATRSSIIYQILANTLEPLPMAERLDERAIQASVEAAQIAADEAMEAAQAAEKALALIRNEITEQVDYDEYIECDQFEWVRDEDNLPENLSKKEFYRHLRSKGWSLTYDSDASRWRWNCKKCSKRGQS